MRTHLSKSLQQRCKAIRRAVASYNMAAAALDVPQPPLDWTEVSKYSFVEQFTLLQDTHNDVRQKRWTQPVYREILKLRRRIARAYEEIQRCNVEVRRVHTAIQDEDRLFTSVLTRLVATSDPVCGAVHSFATRRRRVNHHILQRVHQIYALDGFSGISSPGTRLGGDIHMDGSGVDPESGANDNSDATGSGNDVQEEEELDEDMKTMFDFLDRLHL